MANSSNKFYSANVKEVLKLKGLGAKAPEAVAGAARKAVVEIVNQLKEELNDRLKMGPKSNQFVLADNTIINQRNTFGVGKAPGRKLHYNVQRRAKAVILYDDYKAGKYALSLNFNKYIDATRIGNKGSKGTKEQSAQPTKANFGLVKYNRAGKTMYGYSATVDGITYPGMFPLIVRHSAPDYLAAQAGETPSGKSHFKWLFRIYASANRAKGSHFNNGWFVNNVDKVEGVNDNVPYDRGNVHAYRPAYVDISNTINKAVDAVKTSKLVKDLQNVILKEITKDL